MENAISVEEFNILANRTLQSFTLTFDQAAELKGKIDSVIERTLDDREDRTKDAPKLRKG